MRAHSLRPEPLDKSATAQRIEFLDYLRIFAFGSVVIGHQFYPYLEQVKAQRHGVLGWLASAMMPFCWGGGAGVVVFFLVSGYIITHVVRAEPPQQFFVKRIFRLLPLYWTAVALEMIATRNFSDLNPSTLVPRLLLIGDFLRTPYALKNVEWTLRVEVLFYGVMLMLGILRRRGLKWDQALSGFLLITAMLYVLPPIPDMLPWSRGLTSLFLPFLFVGSSIYLLEKRLALPALCAATGLIIVAAHLWVRPTMNPQALQYQIALYGLGIFLAAWLMRRSLPASRLVTAVSALTYSVYLFHHWSWSFIGSALGLSPGTGWIPDMAIFAALLAGCWALHQLVERPGILVGARICAALRVRASARTVDSCQT